MRKSLLVGYFTLICLSLFAQSTSEQNEVEQLKIEAQNARFSNTNTASQLLLKGLQLSQKNTNEVDIGYFYRKLISEKGNARQMDSAQFYFQEGMRFFWKTRKEKGKKHMNDPLLEAHLHSELAEAYSVNFNFEQSEIEYAKALKLYEKSDDYIGVGISKINLGSLSLKQSNFPSAIETFLESKAIFDTTEYHYISAEICNGISNAYDKILNHDRAIEYAKLYLKFIQKGSFEDPGIINAQIYLAKLYAKNGNQPEMERFLSKASRGIDKLGLNYFKPAIANVKCIELFDQRDFKQAKEVLIAAEKYVHESQVDPMQAFEFKRQLATALLETGERRKAQNLLEDILQVVDSLHLYEEGVQIALTLSEMFEQDGNIGAALNMLKKHQFYYDSSIGLKQQLAVKEVEAKYQATEQRNQLLKQNMQLLEQERTIEEDNWRLRRNQLFIVILLLLLVLTAVSYFYFSRNLRAKKEKELHAHQLKSSEEKLRISRDLHDNIGAELTLMKSKIDQRIFVSEDEAEIAVMSELSDYSKQAMDELRKTIWATKSDEISLSELEQKLDAFVNRFDIEHAFETNYIDRKISALVGLNLYRVAQEAIQNAVKHSQANLLTIEIRETENERTIIQIRDNGKGFNTNETHEGYGVESMKTRITEIEGEFQIDSSDKGTSITLGF